MGAEVRLYKREAYPRGDFEEAADAEILRAAAGILRANCTGHAVEMACIRQRAADVCVRLAAALAFAEAAAKGEKG